MKQQGLKYISKDGPFLDKEKDSKTYLQIKEICDRFSTDEQLQQSLHSGNTQKNECFNNMLSYIAPKNINYSHSNSLSFRFALCISLHNEGFLSTWNEIYNQMGRKLKPKLENHLLKRDNRKVKKRESNETIEYKRR